MVKEGTDALLVAVVVTLALLSVAGTFYRYVVLQDYQVDLPDVGRTISKT